MIEEAGDGSDGDEERLVIGDEQSMPWQEDPYSGLPSSLWETCVALIDAGFTPANSRLPCDKLRNTMAALFSKMVEKCRFLVPMSCSAIIVPGERVPD